MHGRVKVRTTEEQKEIAKREKMRKAVAFKQIIAKVFEKRSAEICDHEGLEMSWNLLNENPDVNTLWNYRREVFQKMKNDMDSKAYQELLERDLSLTKQCLKVNPKSYGSWHHRIWVLDHSLEPDWAREMKLCTEYLRLDERNFHCWDYRRIIAERSGVSDFSEYEFTLKKIEENFSNYSAWHLRSKLLPKLFPDSENKFPINETKHLEELKLVEDAAFTDPEDQSAWFYLRWLLGLKEPKTRFLHLKKTGDEILILVSNAVKVYDTESIRYGVRLEIEVGGERAKGTWTNYSNQPQSCIWVFKPNIKVEPIDSISCMLMDGEMELERIDLSLEGYSAREISFLPEYSPSLAKTINFLLSSVNQLLEIDPDSKWPLLTKVFLMACVDREKFEDCIKSILESLEDIDPLRRGYYRDLRSKLVVEMALAKDENFPGSKSFSLAGEKLYGFYHGQYLWNREDIDLSDNQLSSNCLFKFYTFLHCKNLNLSCNKISDLSGFPKMPNLETLWIEFNSIEVFDFHLLDRFSNLKRIYLGGNPVAERLNLSDYSGPVEIECRHAGS